MSQTNWTDPVLNGGTTYVKAVHIQELRNAINEAELSLDQKASTTYSVSGTGNSFEVTDSSVEGYQIGKPIYFISDRTITGPTTFKLNSLAAKPILKDVTAPLAAGDIVAGEVVQIMYDGTSFQVVTGAGSGASSGGTGEVPVYQSTGTANDLEIAVPGVTALSNGQTVTFTSESNNTGAVTIDVSELGAVPVVHYDGTALIADDIEAANEYQAVYDGTNFVLQDGVFAMSSQNVFARALPSGTGDAVKLVAPFVEEYSAGMGLNFTALADNTGAVTLDVNELGLLYIKKTVSGDDVDLKKGDIKSGQLVSLIYDGTNLRMISGAAGGSGEGSSYITLAATRDSQNTSSPDQTLLYEADIIGDKTRHSSLLKIGVVARSQAYPSGVLRAVITDGTNSEEIFISNVTSSTGATYIEDIDVDALGDRLSNKLWKMYLYGNINLDGYTSVTQGTDETPEPNTLTAEKAFVTVEEGTVCHFKPLRQNTDAATLVINSTSYAIHKVDGESTVAVAAGDLLIGELYKATYDGTNFVLSSTPDSGRVYVDRLNISTVAADIFSGETVISVSGNTDFNNTNFQLLDNKMFALDSSMGYDTAMRFLASVTVGQGVGSIELLVRLTSGGSYEERKISGIVTNGIKTVDIPLPLNAANVDVKVWGRVVSGVGVSTLGHYELWKMN